MALRTILLVDAHEDSRIIYATAFRHGGYTVVESACWDDGVRLAALHRPALVVLELPLMASPAWEALRALKADPALARVPVVGVGTTGQPEARERALRMGCAAFVVKPCPPLALLAACAGALNGHGG